MVLVSHDHRFIFLKTRKTAGTSAEMFLQPFCTPPGTPVVERTRAILSAHGILGARKITNAEATDLDRQWFHHIRAERVRDALGSAVWNGYLRISILRNPFDRMVSYFHDLRRVSDLPALSKQDLPSAFREYIRTAKWRDDHIVTHIGEKFVVQRIIRYENLAEDLDRLCSDLGLPDQLRVGLPRTKVSAPDRLGLPVAAYYDQDTADIVRRRLEWMFRQGGYDPDPPRDTSTTPHQSGRTLQ